MGINNTVDTPVPGHSMRAVDSVSLLSHDEMELLKVYRRGKSMSFADIAITIQEGKRVKLWLTEKLK